MVPTSGALEALDELETKESFVLKSCGTPPRHLSSTAAR